MTLHRIAFSALALAVVSAPASALDFTMDFDNIPVAVGPPPPPDQTFGSAVLGFYDNDPVYGRDGRQAFGVTFSPEALSICSFEVGEDCRGNFPTPPTGGSAVASESSNSFSFFVTPGLYVTQLSFYYTDAGTGSNPAVRLFSGSTELLTLALDPCESGFCDWKQFSVPQSALAQAPVTSVAFLGTANTVAFDDVSVTTTPIPEPSTYALMLGGLALLAGVARRRAR
jgi:hypothetical protein